jgi:outer membrane receptor protein involved in Fe transport
VSHTIEAGLRSQSQPFEGATLFSNIAFYRSTLDNDILFVNSPIQGRAFFQNVGTTLRQGVDVSAQLKTDRLLAWIAYSYIAATFQTGFTASSNDNPGADANGNIQVQPGNRLPGIPANIGKLGVDYRVTDAWTVGGTGIAASGQEDRVRPASENAESLATAVPGAMLLMLPGCGHLPEVEAPTQVNELIEQHLCAGSQADPSHLSR